MFEDESEPIDAVLAQVAMFMPLPGARFIDMYCCVRPLTEGEARAGLLQAPEPLSARQRARALVPHSAFLSMLASLAGGSHAPQKLRCVCTPSHTCIRTHAQTHIHKHTGSYVIAPLPPARSHTYSLRTRSHSYTHIVTLSRSHSHTRTLADIVASAGR